MSADGSGDVEDPERGGAVGPEPSRGAVPAGDDPDVAFLRAALEEARAAAALGEVPVGAVLVLEGAVVARAHNLRETNADPTAHAELIVLREAAHLLDSWRLDGATLYVTLEPCFMCAGALVNARVARLVFGAFDPKAGAVGSLADVARDARLNHRLVVRSGVLAAECGEILKRFFLERRAPGAPSA